MPDATDATGTTDTTGDAGVMARHGYYDQHSATQGSAADLGLGLLADAVHDLDDRVVAGDARPRIADLGCAQGHNSLRPVGAALDALAAAGAGPVDVVHTDLPTNDWATLFAVVEHDPSSYLRAHPDAYPSVIGRSFYDRLVAPASLHVAWTASTLHWLRTSPGPIADHFFVQSSTDAAARERYRAEAAADWLAFLDHRSVELAPTGSVVFVDVRMGDDGTMGSEALFDCLEDALRAARDAGRITADEYAHLAYPTWFRTLDELRAPFTDGRCTGSSGGVLELVHLEPVELDDPFLAAYHADGDATAYGAAQAGFLRGFLAPSFATALATRTAHQRDVVLDEVFTDAARRIAADPAAVSPRYRLVTGRVRRVDAGG